MRHTRASVIARVQTEYRALDGIVRRLRPADFRRPAMGEGAPIRFTVKDVLAHVTAWKWRDVRRLTGDRSPLRPHEAPYGGAVHELNAAIYERSRRTPARTIVAEHRAAHRGMLRALRAAPAEHFTRPWSAIWPVDSVGPSRRIAACTWIRSSRRRGSASGPHEMGSRSRTDRA